jgi:heme exporter protein A
MDHFAGLDLVCERGGRIVFAHLSFSFASGDVLVLTGRNGTGKSSLLRMMAGLLPPAAGTLQWNNEDVGGDPLAHHGRLRFVAHTDALKPALSVLENLRLWAALSRPPGDKTSLSECCHAALDRMGMAKYASVPARYLSAGQRRRLALARLFVAPARLWLLDEPRTALDSDGVARLDTAIDAQRSAGGMICMALHGAPWPVGARFLDVGEYRETYGAATA